MSAIEKYNQRVQAINSLVCVGLDSDISKLPADYQTSALPQYEFNRHIIDSTASYTASYKFNMAFYEARGTQGIKELTMSLEYIKEQHPDILTICDAKRSDIGNTSKAYAHAIFEEIGFDAVTLNPYLGKDAVQPFLDYSDRGCIILCRTSNNGSGEFQNLSMDGKPLWHILAEHVSTSWNENNNCMLVVGATYPEELAQVRAVVGDMTLLIPGIGAQGGDLQAVMQAGLNSEGRGLIISSSRGIIFSDNQTQAVKTLQDDINAFRS